MNSKIKIAIVDDERLFIEGIKALIEKEEGLEVVYTAQNGMELTQDLIGNKMRIDVLLLDLSMPVMDGIDTLRYLVNQNTKTKIIILSSHYNDNLIVKLLDEGASGYLAKNESAKEVIQTIKAIHSKGFYINDHILQLIRNRKIGTKKTIENQELSAREIEVLKLICSEHSTKEIGEVLNISTRTVEAHRNKLFEKTNSKNIAGLAIYAIEHGIKSVKLNKFS